jgi:hypothetical protein
MIVKINLACEMSIDASGKRNSSHGLMKKTSPLASPGFR